MAGYIKYLILLPIIVLSAACGETPSQATTQEQNANGANASPAPDPATPQTTPAPPAPEAAPPVAVDWSEFAVMGLTLGVSIDAVTTHLSAQHPDFKLERHDADIGNIVGSAIRGLHYDGHLTAIQMNAHGVPKRYGQRLLGSFTPPPGEPHLVGLQRMLPFENPRIKADMVKQLVDTYGTPVYQEETRLSWSIDSQGAPILDQALLNQCNKARSRRGHFLNDLRSSDAHPGPYSNCGFTFIVSFSINNNPDLVNGMDFLMYDVALLRRTSMEAVAYSLEEAEKLREAELESARDQQGEAPQF